MSTVTNLKTKLSPGEQKIITALKDGEISVYVAANRLANECGHCIADAWALAKKANGVA